MYPVVDRMGNSFAELLPGVQDYTGTQLNPGPFQIKCVSGGRRSRKNSKRQQQSRQQQSRQQSRQQNRQQQNRQQQSRQQQSRQQRY